MKNFRFWLGDALICLPLVTSIAGGWLFLKTVLPTVEAREAERVRAAYREIAGEIRDGECKEAADCEPKIRKPSGRLGKGTWGHEQTDGGELVWYRPAKSPVIRGAVVPTQAPYAYRRLFATVGLFVLVLLTTLTDLGLRFFRRCTKERDDFLAAAAHDLATPLVGLRRMIGRNDEEAKRLTARMIRLVENIRDYLRLGGRREVHLSTFPIGRAFDEAYQLWADDFADAASGPVALSGDRSLMVRADETMLVQVFWNLLGNELKYAAESGPIAAAFSARDGQVEFVLKDTGPGMSASQLRHAFDRYYRAQSALQSGKGGFGIGLCTAREFVRQCGGELVVRANRPTGCLFRLTLPDGGLSRFFTR